MKPNIELIHGDSLQAMKSYGDNHFDVAIVDPPYGIGENWKKDKHSKFYRHNSTYKNDSIPGKQYFQELFRVSKNQIIWGANYFTDFLPAVNSWIVWDKQRDYEKQHMAEAELAWTSFKVPVRIASYLWNGCCRCEPRAGFHPHEKPTKLYKWILEKYTREGDLILDTHLGSGSIAIACNELKRNLVGYEIDQEYYEKACKRFEEQTAQIKMELV